MEKGKNNETASLSKQRKLERKKDIAKRKKSAVTNKIIVAAVCLVILGLVAWAIASAFIKKANSVTANGDYSAQINDNGMIKDVKASDYVTLPDYNNITADKADIEYPDDKVEEDIKTVLENNKYVDDTEGLTAKNGDTVDIDYVGTVDGTEFEGGSDQGHSLTLGSGTFIDDFEAQIEGHTVGEEFTVEVTFPEDYSNNADLAGRDAVFTVTLNGIYTTPEFTDEFVAEKLSDYASTTAEYRQYLKDKNYKQNLQDYLKKYITENTVIKSNPDAYYKQLKSIYKSEENSYYEYMNQMYSSYYGYTPYASFEDYISQTYSMTEYQYDVSLKDQVVDNMKYVLFCQAVAEKEGISVTLDETREYYIAQGGTEDNFNSQIESVGQGYMVQQYLCEKVINTISERVTVK